MKSLNQWIQDNINHNQGKIHHIQDGYFKDKLKSGLIRYEPDQWSEVSERDERSFKER